MYKILSGLYKIMSDDQVVVNVAGRVQKIDAGGVHSDDRKVIFRFVIIV